MAVIRHPVWVPEVYASRKPFPLKTPAVPVGAALLVVVVGFVIVVGLVVVVACDVVVGDAVELDVDVGGVELPATGAKPNWGPLASKIP
jgi:hypothetical protein